MQMFQLSNAFFTDKIKLNSNILIILSLYYRTQRRLSMPYCPKCRYEYNPEISTCPDGDERLVISLSETDVESSESEIDNMGYRRAERFRLFETVLL